MPSSTDGIEITVKADQKIIKDSNQITVVVQRSTIVEELKKLIKEKTGIEPEKHTLQLQNQDGTATTMLYDSVMMADYGIKEGALILLFINFEIKVQTDRKISKFGKTFSVEVNGTDTVKILKEKIKRTLTKNGKTNYGIELEKISLQYGKNDDFLNDEKTIDDYPIKEGDIVQLCIGDFRINITQYGKNNETEFYYIWVKGEETVATLKKKIRSESGIEPEEQTLKTIKVTVTADEHIFKKLLSFTNQITVQMNGWDTVEDLKKKIMDTLEEETKTEIGTDHKRLTLKYGQIDNYDVLKDGKIINDYLNGEGDNYVSLSVGEFPIVVRYEKWYKNYTNYTIWMNSKETVAILKKKIKSESGFKPDDQILKVVDPNGDGGTLTVLEDDEKTMTNYGIGEGTTILLVTEFEIVVTYKKDKEEKTVTVQTKGTDVVANLRSKIMKKIKDDFPLIEYGSIVIKDHPRSDYDENLHGYYSSKTLKECGIGEGSTIYLVSCWVKYPNKSSLYVVNLM
ncbi:hypothetical protein niasHT_024780 [Heterodera trifolii]|uniref:Ubiquitin-like domain-containing protein n=1 Tax=Heterodera trifolii TaxID=157864 RepID=A0ABD2JHH1_9BILA